MIELIKTVNTYTKESFIRGCQPHTLLAKDYKNGKLVPATTNHKEFAGVYLGNNEVQSYGKASVLIERKKK